MHRACRRIAAWSALVSLVGFAGEASQAPRTSSDSSRLAADRGYSPPRTPWGDPDLQGVWPSGQMIEVPFERPGAFGTRAELNDVELAERAAQVRAQVESDLAETGSGIGSPPTAPPPHWLERGLASRQASLIVDPPNGLLPPLTEDGARRAERWRTTSADSYPYAGPEDLTPYDRCITRGVLGSTFPNIYNTGMQIMQVPGAVVIRYEMVHETRIIRIDGRPHLSPALRSYMGDPLGRWEGNTLVVDTTNFNGKTGSYGRNGNGNPTTEALRLVERFRLIDANTLEYEVTVTDPLTWSRPWTVRFPIVRDDGYAMLEYACHEGNYAMTNSLKAARSKDR
ncbi:MAG TPA: hypothetical protein VFV95_15145 [Vicinamibacterales bacterium]|nr:hypothetical protein [Vicinamibacterales bacterium]